MVYKKERKQHSNNVKYMFLNNLEPESENKALLKWVLTVIVTTIIVIHSPGEIETTQADDTLSAETACNIIESLSAEDFSKIDTVDLIKLIEYTEPNWSSDIERLYYPIILKNSMRYDVDPLLVKAMIMAESGFNPKAVSQVGAQGLMQLMPLTAKALGVVDVFNPEENIQGGVKYIKRLLDSFNGNVEFALAAYNAGSKKVRKFRGIPPYPETKKYVKKVNRLLADYKKVEPVSVKCNYISQI